MVRFRVEVQTVRGRSSCVSVALVSQDDLVELGEEANG